MLPTSAGWLLSSWNLFASGGHSPHLYYEASATIVTFILLVPMLLIFVLAERLSKDDVMAAGLGKL